MPFAVIALRLKNIADFWRDSKLVDSSIMYPWKTTAGWLWRRSTCPSANLLRYWRSSKSESVFSSFAKGLTNFVILGGARTRKEKACLLIPTCQILLCTKRRSLRLAECPKPRMVMIACSPSLKRGKTEKYTGYCSSTVVASLKREQPPAGHRVLPQGGGSDRGTARLDQH